MSVVPEPTRPPPSVEECFNAASAEAAAVYLALHEQLDHLVDANQALDDVIMRAAAQEDHLRSLRDEALSQRRRNTEAIACLSSAIENAPAL